MVNVQIEETTLLNLFMDRLEYWTTDSEVLALYENYLSNLIDWGCFDGSTLDVMMLIDNLYINNTIIMDKEDLDNNNIDIEDSDKVLAKNANETLFLVSSY